MVSFPPFVPESTLLLGLPLCCLPQVRQGSEQDCQREGRVHGNRRYQQGFRTRAALSSVPVHSAALPASGQEICIRPLPCWLKPLRLQMPFCSGSCSGDFQEILDLPGPPSSPRSSRPASLCTQLMAVFFWRDFLFFILF